MPRQFDEEEDDDLLDEPVRREREISLGTTTLLGIFFGLALLLAVVFGLGYSFGSSRHPATATATTTDPSSPDFNSFKPAPGSPLSQQPKYPVPESTTPVASYIPPATSSTVTIKDPAPNTSRQAQADFDPDANITSGKSAPTYTTPAPPPPAPRPMMPTAPTAQQQTSFMVQVAAFTREDDADPVMKELKRRGYAVAIRSVPQDQLLHVQLGPFSNRRDAEAMRQRLLGDGFNAMIK